MKPLQLLSVGPGSTFSAGPTTFEGIASSLKLAQDAASTPVSATALHSARGSAHAKGETGNRHAADSSMDDRQPDGTLESALSRLGGMLENAGPLTDQPCSQFEPPAGQLPPAESILAFDGSTVSGVPHTCLKAANKECL